jgi:2-polyprenyl-6-methoxyphenol hydroxylase-like FAD-dependent oxidoreductase
MMDAFQLAQYFTRLDAAPDQAEHHAHLLEQEMLSRGRKAVLASRNAAHQYHQTNRFQQGMRNLGFWFAHLFINSGRRS